MVILAGLGSHASPAIPLLFIEKAICTPRK